MNNEVMKALEEQGKAFEGFKTHYNGELTRLSNMLKDMEAKGNRPMAPGIVGSADLIEARKGVDRFLRTGDGELDRKSLSTVTGGAGYTVPAIMAEQVYTVMKAASPMRQWCNVVNPLSGDYTQPILVGGGAVTHAGEEDARDANTTPTFTEAKPSLGEAFVNWPCSQRALDDSGYDLARLIEEEGSRAIAEAQNGAFVSGNGTDKAKGFLAYTQAATDDGTRAFGEIQYVPTGVAGGFKTASATVSPGDDLITLIYKLKAGHRQGAAFMMNSETLSVVRKWKDYSTGAMLWQPSLMAGQPSLLCGFPVVENEDMPAIGSGTTPIAFGNWKRAYTIVDRTLTLLRDPYTNKPYVNLYMSSYYGGMLVDSEAVKVLKLSAS
jgi:HK97 family phage major capsid protein